MKPYSFLIVLSALIVFSCKNETPESTDRDGLTDSTLIKDSEEHPIELVDSAIFHIGNHEFEIRASSPNEFNAAADPFKMKDTSEANRIQKVASAVSRSGDSLIFKCLNNKNTYLINDNDDEDDVDDYSVYTFIKDMPEINQWLVMGVYYEAYGYVFINKSSGDTTLLYGMPVVSPDNKYIITFNQDIQAGFTFNGFQLFEVNGSELIELGEKELYNWGPDNVRWKDETTLLVEQSHLKFDYTNSEQSITTEYIEIKMK
ncbi:hypothetical protein [Cytophaga aurantiaca]|uniref:hypothetical protein n=1 Tax=Cytophaga aurantiaca TaxID=29530 RepID=UPI000378A225|nr:hypothetical protein [Cytophaga aurantiaca]